MDTISTYFPRAVPGLEGVKTGCIWNRASRVGSETETWATPLRVTSGLLVDSKGRKAHERGAGGGLLLGGGALCTLMVFKEQEKR